MTDEEILDELEEQWFQRQKMIASMEDELAWMDCPA